MQPVPAYPDRLPDALRVEPSTALDWRLFARYLRVDLARAETTIENRLRCARHMARNGFRWPNFRRDPALAREEARRWVDWKKATCGRDSSSNYELVINDVAAYLAQLVDPRYQLAKVPYTDVDYEHPDPYSPAEIAGLQTYTAKSDFTSLRRRAMILFASFWGGRRVEHVRADLADVDLDALTLRMKLPGKGGKKRKIPLPSLLASPKRAFVAYLEERARRFPGAAALWLTEDGQRFTPASLGRETWHMSQELGFAVSFNRWRRSWQTTIRRCGVRKDVAKYLLGHQWGSDATDHYWEPDVEDARRELQVHKVPGFIRSRDARTPGHLELPVPFARALVAGETETALAM